MSSNFSAGDLKKLDNFCDVRKLIFTKNHNVTKSFGIDFFLMSPNRKIEVA